MQKIKPLGDRVIVKPLGQEEITKSGIVLPDTVDKEKQETGEVIAVGPGKLLDSGQRAPMEVAPGNKVLFKKYSLDEFKIDEQEFGTIQLSDVIAIIE